tara:strand:+ start:974 stop:1153 length:180 start_codon:yes stop_codon:yes gene_type:complete
MATEVKEQQSEQVRQHTRMAAGAWVTGETLKEQSKATIPEANSDHGNFSQPKGIEKSNA